MTDYNDLDKIDPDEDQEVLFEQEEKSMNRNEEDKSIDEEFEDDPRDIIEATEKLGYKVKRAAIKALGFDGNREDYGSTKNYLSEYVAEHGIWGLAKGLVIATLAAIGEVLHAFAYNLMGRPEHINLKRAIGATNLMQKGKEERKQRNEEKEVENQEIDERTPKENTETQQDVFAARNEKDDELDQSIEKELNDKSKELFEDKESLNQIIDVCVNDPNIMRMFKEAGIYPINVKQSLDLANNGISSMVDKNTKNIYLFSENAEMDMKRILCIPKKDFMMGDATMFSAALFTYNKQQDDMNERLKSVIQASMLQARIRKAIHENLLNNLPDNNKVTLVKTKFETPEMDSVNLNISLIESSQIASVEYNGKEIGSFNINEVEIGDLEKLAANAMREYENSKERHFVLGDIEVERLAKDTIAIEINGNREELKIREEKDLQKVSAYLQNIKGFSTEEANIRAMLIGAYALPGMQKTIDSFGYEMNPFKNERKKVGDIVIGKHGNIERYKLEISENKETHISEIKNTSEVISYMPKYWKGVNLEKCVPRIERAMHEKIKHDAIDDIIVPADGKQKIETLNDPYWSNGHVAFQELKNKSVLDGIDLSAFKFKERKESKEHDQQRSQEKRQNKDQQSSTQQKKNEKKENSTDEKIHSPSKLERTEFLSQEDMLENAGFKKFEPDESFKGFENASYIKTDIEDMRSRYSSAVSFFSGSGT